MTIYETLVERQTKDDKNYDTHKDSVSIHIVLTLVVQWERKGL